MTAVDIDVAAAIATERQAVVAYAATYCADLDSRVERGRMTAREASILKRRIAAFAEGIGQGLHVDG